MKDIPRMQKTMASFIRNVLPKNPRGIYLVGGSVRDQLMGITPSDFDIVTSRKAILLAREITTKIGGRIIEIGKKPHKIIKVISHEITIDIASLQGNDLGDDISKRDFTINSIVYDLSNKELIDPTNGLKDIENRQLRMVEKSVFKQDPIRLIRAYRIALNLNFKITLDTQIEIARNRACIAEVAEERIWTELLKIFTHPRSHTTIADMGMNGVIFSIFPELSQASTSNLTQNSHRLSPYTMRAYNYIESTLANTTISDKSILHRACKQIIGVSKYPLLKLALLLRHMGIPVIMGHLPDNYETFEKNILGKGRMAHTISRRLKLSKEQQLFVKSIITGFSLLPLLYDKHQRGKLTKNKMFHFFEQCGSSTVAIISHAISDVVAKRSALSHLDVHFLNFLYFLVGKYIGPYCNAIKKEPVLTGYDLIKSLHLTPSPQFKQILALVHRARISGKISNKKNALELVKQYLK